MSYQNTEPLTQDDNLINIDGPQIDELIVIPPSTQVELIEQEEVKLMEQLVLKLKFKEELTEVQRFS
ncbi:unnamed protein product [Brachionus calyciflorus]|uniref:Uncharacterized protein n=1 Tax=Brachionus calyciflorus TaxID=104777 RepID=A0A814LJ85_9BILA|nr:unnamed protein product [Brachionus calyciflorus]